MRSVSGMHARRDSAGSNPRLCLKKRNFLKTGGCMQGAIVRVRIPGYVLTLEQPTVSFDTARVKLLELPKYG